MSEQPKGYDELLTVEETAALLGVQPSTIRAWVCQRRIQYVKIGRLVRFRRSYLEAYIASQTVPADVRSPSLSVTTRIGDEKKGLTKAAGAKGDRHVR